MQHHITWQYSVSGVCSAIHATRALLAWEVCHNVFLRTDSSIVVMVHITGMTIDVGALVLVCFDKDVLAAVYWHTFLLEKHMSSTDWPVFS